MECKENREWKSESLLKPIESYRYEGGSNLKGRPAAVGDAAANCRPPAPRLLNAKRTTAANSRTPSRLLNTKKSTVMKRASPPSSGSTPRATTRLIRIIALINGSVKCLSPYFSVPDGAIILEKEYAIRYSNGKTKIIVEIFNGEEDEKRKQRSQLTAAQKKLEAYRRLPPGLNFKPPRSDHYLLQESYYSDPWKVLVICMLLNLTTGSQVRKVLPGLFKLCPDAETTVGVDVEKIEAAIRTLGLHKRAQMIKRFSAEYLGSNWTHVTQLHGVGKYGADAYATFCSGILDGVMPRDHKLLDYWNEIYPEKFLQCN